MSDFIEPLSQLPGGPAVCLVLHLLDATIIGHTRHEKVPPGTDCTRCGMCVDICPAAALKFEFKGLSKTAAIPAAGQGLAGHA